MIHARLIYLQLTTTRETIEITSHEFSVFHYGVELSMEDHVDVMLSSSNCHRFNKTMDFHDDDDDNIN